MSSCRVVKVNFGSRIFLPPKNFIIKSSHTGLVDHLRKKPRIKGKKKKKNTRNTLIAIVTPCVSMMSRYRNCIWMNGIVERTREKKRKKGLVLTNECLYAIV